MSMSDKPSHLSAATSTAKALGSNTNHARRKATKKPFLALWCTDTLARSMKWKASPITLLKRSGMRPGMGPSSGASKPLDTVAAAAAALRCSISAGLSSASSISSHPASVVGPAVRDL